MKEKSYEQLKADNELYKTVLAFTWTAIAFGTVIGMIGIWG